jgi:formate-nitrite transporter family protein
VSPEIDFYEYLRFLSWATLGNSFGGAVFVAILKYKHASV